MGPETIAAAAPSPPWLTRAGTVALAATGSAWAMVLARILRHSIYVSHDTVISYAHVWYVSEWLWQGRGLPLRMPILGAGEAYAFPYGFAPWSLAALLRPAVGDWSVTLVLVAAAVGLILGTFWAFPELRRGWWATAVLVEPALVSAPIIGQISFISGAALLMVAVGAWRRDRTALAVGGAALAQATHPAIVLPLTAALVVGWLRWEADRGRLVRAYALSLVLALPAMWITLQAPVIHESSLWTKLFGFVATIGPRSLVVVVPIALVLVRSRLRRAWVGPVVVGALVVADVAVWAPLGMPWAWRGLYREPDVRMVAFVESADFTPGATYRLLRAADGKIGMYQLLRGGGRLDSEFFPESIQRRRWDDVEQYVDFLRRRRVDFVMIWQGYDETFHTDEGWRLDQLAVMGCVDDVGVRLVTRTADYDLYAVASGCASPASTM